MSADARPVIDVRNAAVAGAAGVAVRGDVDAATAPRLSDALDDAVRVTTGPFVLDLSGVEFLDSSGINALLRVRSLLGRADRPLVLVCPPGAPRRVLELAGIDDLFALYATREDAARAVSSMGP
ncbi:MAG TPA: STAS domain-containing protein [Solirubrobacteraceae bacterium]